MRYSEQPPRYTAYLNSAYGYKEVGTTNHKAAAWELADEAARQANGENAFHSWPEIFDKAANQGRGSMSFRVR